VAIVELEASLTAKQVQPYQGQYGCVAGCRAGQELKRIRLDTLVGMAFSHLTALFIVIATAATLHAHGITNVESSAQAAQAWRPIAGNFAFALFAIGIIGTGMHAVPLMVVMMLIASNARFMGRLVVSRGLAIGGWIATAVKAAATLTFFLV
jgi:Mn2+/Fe2+ NRAMP family transporter